MSRLSTELNEDAIINMVDKMSEEFAIGFATAEDTIAFNGTGAASQHGTFGLTVSLYQNPAGARMAGGVNSRTAAGAGTGILAYGAVDATSLTSLMALLPEYAIPGAKFYCSNMFKQAVFGRLQMAAGGNTRMETAEGPVDAYNGAPIVTSQVLPQVDTSAAIANDVICLYGNLPMACTFGERRGINVKISDERYFELDQIALKATERIDIVCHDIGTTNVVGPIVAMVGSST